MTEGAQLGRCGLGIVQLQPAMLRKGTLLAERPGCSFIWLGVRSLPLCVCCCIQRGTPFLGLCVAWCCSPHRLPFTWPGSALHVHHPAKPARRERKRSDHHHQPRATRHALPRSDRLVLARSRPDALVLPGIVPPSHLVATLPPVLIGTAESTRSRRLPQDRQPKALFIRCFTLVFCASIGAVLRLESSSPLPAP